MQPPEHMIRKEDGNPVLSRTEATAVCVFCASSDHVAEAYVRVAEELGKAMASRRITLVYGGGNNGLMGYLSESMYASGGRIVGVITRGLKELGYACEHVDDMIVTDGLRERKAIMESRAHGFIGLPGGFGTLEELLEIITLKQLGFHSKPIVLLNVLGFFDNLLRQLDTAYTERFIEESCRGLYHVTESVADALDTVCGQPYE
jgi:hypothetical protein